VSFLDIERGSKIDHRVSTGAIVNGAVTPPKLDRAYPQVVGGTISGGTIDGSYAYNFSSSSGTFAGIATQHVLKAGDTMTGNLEILTPTPTLYLTDSDNTNCKTKFISYLGSGSETILDINPLTIDSSKSSLIRFFRDVNTSGAKVVRIYKGDGTGTLTFELDASTGDIIKMGSFNTGSPITFNNGLTSTTGPNDLSGTASVGLKIPTVAPPSPEAGSMYFDTSSTTLYIHDGSVWRSVALT